jgi:nucleotide-binding universal stress UspA family protein
MALRNDECAPSVIQIAEALATTYRASPKLLYTIELMFAATPESVAGDPAVMMAAELLDPELHERDEAEIRAALRVNTGLPATWPFVIEVGDAASCITQHARRDKADLVLMGLRHHGRMGRVLGNDTLRAVMVLGETPVFAVHPLTRDLPSTVVVAMDFSRSSIRAARLARRIMKPGGTMHLVFVEPEHPRTSAERLEGEEMIEQLGIEAAFGQVMADLRSGEAAAIKYVTGHGDPATQLTIACEHYQPDLLAIGKHRHGMIERLRLGSVTSALISDGRWSMLVTPPES